MKNKFPYLFAAALLPLLGLLVAAIYHLYHTEILFVYIAVFLMVTYTGVLGVLRIYNAVVANTGALLKLKASMQREERVMKNLDRAIGTLSSDLLRSTTAGVKASQELVATMTKLKDEVEKRN